MSIQKLIAAVLFTLLPVAPPFRAADPAKPADVPKDALT